MSERLRPRDVALLAAESPSAPRHNATVEIFDCGPSGFDYDRLLDLIEDRISFAPRYRQRVRTVPGRLANPVWVDDEDFDLEYHVRRSALPRPGSLDQLRDLVARIISRPLDRHRPLWEMYLVEGLAEGHVALLSKSHQALVDGVHTVDLGQVLLDSTPEPKTLGGDEWRPRRAPGSGGPGRGRPAGHRLRGHRRGHRAHPRRLRAAHRRRCAAPHGPGGERPRRAPSRARVPDQRRALPAAPVRDRAHRARGVPPDPGGARRHGERRRAGHRHRGAAHLADDALGVPGRPAPDPRPGAGLGDRRRARGDLAGQPDRRPRRRPAGGRGQPGGPPAPGLVLLPGAQGHRARRRRGPAGRDRRLRAHHVPRRRLRGSRCSTSAASSSASPTCPAPRRRCTPPVRGWSRRTRCTRCCPTTPWPSA